MGVKLGPSP